MKNYSVADVSYDTDGEMEQFLIFWESGEPDTRRATEKNVLLFDPEDELPFDGGMHQFLNGEHALKLSDDPRIVVSQCGDEYSYMLTVGPDTVETTPTQAEDFLGALRSALSDKSLDGLTSLHADILDTQVRRSVVDPLCATFSQSNRIERTGRGWLVDDFYLVDWNAKMYYSDDDTNDGDYVRGSDGVVKKDKSYELVRLNYSLGSEFDSVTVTIDGDERALTELEMVFLSKVTWLLDRRHYHPDEPFWEYTDQWADVPEREPNMDKFTL